MTKNLVLGLACLSFIGAAAAQSPVKQVKQRLDSFFDLLAAKNLAMGSIAISKNGKIFYRRSLGEARIGNADKMVEAAADANTEYRIGSISKLFTATLVFQLIEEKRLYLDDKLSAFFPELPNARQITIANLLDHRSGLHDFTKGTDFDNWKEGPRKQEELLALISKHEPDFPPGTKADYNNSNYLVLTFIIEQVTRTPYYALLNQRIIHRLGLRQTYYVQQPALTRYEAASYRYFDGKWNTDKAAWLDNFRGAGGIISNPTDMVAFMNALFTGKLVTQQSLQTMEKLVDGYGMGMFPFDVAGHPGFGHNGKTEGFASSLTYYPDDRIAIAYCTNGEVWSKNWMLDAVRSILFKPGYDFPTFNAVKIPPAVLQRDTGRYRSPEGLEATVRQERDGLVLETKGTSFPLVALGEKRFWNQRFGFFFDIDATKLTIYDVESEYYLEKQ